ncbi:hypothetical protein ACWXV6_12910 [Pantoea ananatis]
MKLEKAYSNELKRNVTADEADKLHARGDLASKHNFKCPEPNCHAQVTCANLDKPRGLRKREPYFKFVSEHSIDCRLEAESDKNIRYIKLTQQDPEALPFIIDDAVDIDFTQPNKRNIRELTDENEESNTKRLGSSSLIDNDEAAKHRHSRKRLSGLVNAFMEGESFFINTTEGKIHVKNFFINVCDKKDINEYLDEPRIFHGKAWVNRNDNYYLVRFDSEMRAGNLKCKPTFFIPSRLVDTSAYGRTSRNKLDKIASQSKPLNIFIFSELPPVKSNTGDYINFILDDLTYLYYLPWNKETTKKLSEVSSTLKKPITSLRE